MYPIFSKGEEKQTMDAMEEVEAPVCGDVHAVMKRKRTKRQRLLLLPSAPTASSTSSTGFSGSITEEEEDMANCLMLLAQGRTSPKTETAMEGGGSGAEKYTSRRFAEAATTTSGKAGFYVYECKTCNKCFSSFQALGGHRASHKKPKLGVPAMSSINDDKKVVATDDGLDISLNSLSKPLIVLAGNTNSISKPRIHECSICGSEFSSGQALGGHMRRHRPASTSESQEPRKERNLLSLDLNLPAPSDNDHGSDFAAPVYPFSISTKKQLVFLAPTLVDCHY